MDAPVTSQDSRTAKQLLRQRVTASLRALPSSERARHSSAIRQHLVDSGLLADGMNIFAFAALPSEPDLVSLTRSTGARLYFPKTAAENTLEFFETPSESNLCELNNKIREPSSTHGTAADPSMVDLVLVPGLAFDPKTGARLGRGGGYYDRFLNSLAPESRLIGICFSIQLHRNIPVEPHDQAVPEILTESGLIQCQDLS